MTKAARTASMAAVFTGEKLPPDGRAVDWASVLSPEGR